MIDFGGILKSKGAGGTQMAETTPFHRKHAFFKEILQSNSQGMRIVSELEGLVYGHMPFTLDQVLHKAEVLFDEVRKIIRGLEGITNREQNELSERLSAIIAEVTGLLSSGRSFSSTELVIPLQKVSRKLRLECGRQGS